MMSNGVIWMFSEKGGYYACYDSNDVEKLQKMGFSLCGCKPSEHKAKAGKPTIAEVVRKVAPKEYVPEVLIEKQPDELSKDDLLALAADSGIAVDKRWNVQRIKEALGL